MNTTYEDIFEALEELHLAVLHEGECVSTWHALSDEQRDWLFHNELVGVHEAEDEVIHVDFFGKDLYQLLLAARRLGSKVVHVNSFGDDLGQLLLAAAGVQTPENRDLGCPDYLTSRSIEWWYLAAASSEVVMATPDVPPRRRRTPKPALTLQRQIRALLAICQDLAVEGCWIDMIGREEHYIDAALARRELGLPPVPGRRMISKDQELG